MTRSLTDFDMKMRRRGGAGAVKSLKDFINYVQWADRQCVDAVGWGQRLRERYDLGRNAPTRCRAPVQQQR